MGNRELALTGRKLTHNHKPQPHTTTNKPHPTTKQQLHPQLNKVTAEIATGKRPDPSRTRKLSLPAPMILPNPGGKVGHRRTHLEDLCPPILLGGRGISTIR